MGNCCRAVRALWLFVVASVILGACGLGKSSETPSVQIPDVGAVALEEGEKLRVVATTTIVADVIQNVGGNHVDLHRLMPLGVDPHAFEPTPQDAAAIEDADVVFINGAGLEAFMVGLLANVGVDTPVVSLSDHIQLLDFGGHGDAQDEDGHGDAEADPHIWFDPNNVMTWVSSIQETLSELDPANAASYQRNSQAYTSELKDLDVWVRERVAEIPQDRRKLVTDHSVFTYFTEAYGFDQAGVVTAGSSTLSEPSARELAALQEVIRQAGVPAIFVSTTVNPRMAEQIAQDTGIRIVPLYTGSLSDSDGPASTYLDFMRYDVDQITEALQ